MGIFKSCFRHCLRSASLCLARSFSPRPPTSVQTTAPSASTLPSSSVDTRQLTARSQASFATRLGRVSISSSSSTFLPLSAVRTKIGKGLFDFGR
ncbi:unnamed protein product [Linum trigynum]|uniref:Uncharacterized protein n=1 Tax=Linum trigynum TaxID=586398 RepID=A0AAV2CPN5_9ROSI